MANLICQNIRYLPIRFLSSITNNVIIPLTGYVLSDLSLKNKLVFVETQKQRNGNDYFEQSLQVIVDNISAINTVELLIDNLILEVTPFDKQAFIWGNIANPVMVEIKTENGEVEIKFFRNSILPEFIY